MVYQVNAHHLFFSFLFCSLFSQQPNFTYYFSYITSLNYLDTNILYLLVIIFTLCLFSVKLFFIVFKFFLISSIFLQKAFFKTLISSLVVGTVLIHPIMFYICLIIFLVKTYNNYNFSTVYSLRVVIQSLLILLSITMLLGGFWATQSNAWGYFWVNDLVEWILLLIILLVIVWVHMWSLNSLPYNSFFTGLFLLTLIIFIRIGFFSTRHNFVSFSISMYTIFYIYIILLSMLVSIFFKNFFKFNYKIRIIHIGICLSLCLHFQFLIKFFFFTFFILFFKKSFRYVKAQYFHYTFLFFFVIWISPFIFFKVYNTWYLSLITKPSLLFNSYFSNLVILFFNNNFNETLSFVTYIFTYFKCYNIVGFQHNYILILNNHQLVYIFLFLIIIARKIVWI